MKKLISLAFIFILGCANPSYKVFIYDNGPDYVVEDTYRIVDSNNLMGFARKDGSVLIKPKFAFAYPFCNGVAQVTNVGYKKWDSQQEHWTFISDNWYYIDKKGNRVEK